MVRGKCIMVDKGYCSIKKSYLYFKSGYPPCKKGISFYKYNPKYCP